MILTVKTLAQKAIPLQVDPTTTVLNIKELLKDKEGFNVPAQKLIYSGKILTDEQTVQGLGVKETDFMVVMVQKPKPAPASSSSSSPAPSTPATVPPASTPAAPRGSGASIDSAAPDTPSPASMTSATTSSDPTFAIGAAFETAVSNMVDMGYPRDQVVAAMRAAFNNPDRAFDYLLNGIPTNLQQSTVQPALATAPVAEAPSASPADPNNLFDLAQQHLQAQQQGTTGGLGDVGNMVPPEQLEQLRTMLQANPAMIQPIIQQLVQANPQLGSAIQANPQLFFQMLLGGGVGSEDEDGDGEHMVDIDGNPVLPGANIINITEDEKAAIDRLVALGFDRRLATEAFLLCDKNEELAANFLFENQLD